MKTPAAPTTEATSTTDDTRPPTKLERVLTWLVEHGSINRLEAEKAPIFDHALPSTMSNEIKKRLGLEFTSVLEKSTGFNGMGAYYKRYKFTFTSSQAAKKIINNLRKKRGAPPIQWVSECD
ncbi:hypothetical protein [Neptunomonas concharum]|uniref:Uncharacterized protein n=1 Tax=Neptunomonas concharum TaxID=1031538 RepID=A0A5P1RDG1_9GAMM|nr:hypothetical protein [Neptunomonas concharum]QEQ97322.1 hypothetical protein F0U83_11705 [Neptunomonas concharum]